jgi:hypothetical protein
MWEVLTKMCHPDAAGKVNGSPSHGKTAPAMPELPFKLTYVEATNGHSNGHHPAAKALSLDGSEVSASSKYYFTATTVPVSVRSTHKVILPNYLTYEYCL